MSRIRNSAGCYTPGRYAGDASQRGLGSGAANGWSRRAGGRYRWPGMLINSASAGRLLGEKLAVTEGYRRIGDRSIIDVTVDSIMRVGMI
ncbi:hypothetical protein VTN00DRAFT_7010 [Thermoascus crustaceus]|uniref:uncharacterized protein n=1 Tax=Thermoascus crustaceus TaxID=5088 RepID=UPI00374303B1